MRAFPATLLRRTAILYTSLAAVWSLIVAWQVVEHRRVRDAARAALLKRAQDISTTMGLVIRSQRRFGGIVSQERIESALDELVRVDEINSLALINAIGDIVASAGAPVDFTREDVLKTGEQWEPGRVTVVNPVDLGASLSGRGETNRPTIVLPRRESSAGQRDDPAERLRFEPGTNAPGRPLPAPGEAPREGARRDRDDDEGRPPWARGGRPPFRMDEAQYKELLERRGLHGLVITMSTDAYRQSCRRDLWMRGMIGCLAGVSVLGLGLAWRNLAKSSELQMRLMRARELNTHLKEMNVAAAGLAHETRNPLNIIRGLAQMISRQQDASAEIRRKSREIIDETDRVTAQLNEFINFSRPREVRRAAVEILPVVQEVARALTHDLEEKCVRLHLPEGSLTVEADEPLLRQALFNLLLNAVQAVERGGDIEVAVWRQNDAAVLEIRDNGPGVAPEHRAEIFKPYFTTHQQGTGLGLAVVQQIVLAHGWEIEFVPRAPRGAIFRISHLKLASRA
ncbi:MAG TPA: ATP-binding protein [Methylomirabilota bacterium]|nr:ATP-binding protein [Methylomirabilota bacterium]